MNDTLIQFLQTHHLWVTVAIPGAAAALVLFLERRTALSGPMLIAVMSGMALSWSTRQWESDGLRIFPVAMVLIAALSVDEFSAGTWKRAARRGAIIAAWVWASTLMADLLGCLVQPECRMRDTGGAGLLDSLVVGPAASIALALLLWLALGWPKRRAEEVARAGKQPETGASDPI